MKKQLFNLAIENKLIKRACIFAVIVGSILITINHSHAILNNQLDRTRVIQILLTLLVPFFVSLISSLLSIIKFKDLLSINKYKIYSLESQVNIISRFPNQNPHPVFRLSKDGELLYANSASEPVLKSLGIKVGSKVPDSFKGAVDRILSGSREELELKWERRIYSLLVIDVPEFGFINIYGTDVTAMKVINKFPDLNPNPVFRLSLEGDLLYNNQASIPIINALGIKIGDKVPEHFKLSIDGVLSGDDCEMIEIKAAGRIYSLLAVYIYEFGFINVYGTDITAMKLINKFPDQNPNPVLRISKDLQLIYANRSSDPIINTLRTEVGELVPVEFMVEINRVLDTSETVEIDTGEKVFDLLIVSVYEFGFINIYGTDITARKEVEIAHKENEKLLLNILPPSIAGRLKSGEKIIADKFNEISILFTDVVGFTELSATLSPSELVEILNKIFTVFDNLTEKYNLEKIKTIGDSYMVVGGLNDNPDFHVEDIACMALDIHKEIRLLNKKYNLTLDVRTGIHKGPAVAGVIGIKNFIYDVWGDTVNTASRMESHSLPGRIQITETVFETLKDKFHFEQRGIIEVKGKEPLMTYFLEKRLENKIK